MVDPFADTPGATKADFNVKPPRRTATEKPCDWSSKPAPKKADLDARQRDWFERGGWTYARVETYNAYTGRKSDLWTFGDWLAVRGDETLLVQTCAHGDASKREKKARATPELAKWLAGGNRRFVVHGWRQPGGPGTRWEVVEREVVIEKGAAG